jgi:hypothetical protein
MVKYEKLNPNISSPVAIPFYGEIITARWGYEALAVEQFMNNKYERQFYNYEKIMSQSSFTKQYWYEKIDEKLKVIENSFTANGRNKYSPEDLKLIRNEIKKQVEINPEISFPYLAYLTPAKITTVAVKGTRDYVENIKSINKSLYNSANRARDYIIAQQEAKDKPGFQEFKSRYFNDKLEEFVTNKTEPTRITEYKNELFQKLNPIFLDPKNKFLRAHFYAPRKQIFGRYFNTFGVNVIVLWVMTGILYLALYFRVLKKLLDSGEFIMGRKRSE